MSQRELNRAFLARQLLLERHSLTPLEAVERLAGLQAQVPRPPFVGLWTRLADFDRRQLLSALHDRTIVRATTMRGTIHLMSAADYRAFRGVLHPMLTRGPVSVLRDKVKDMDFAAVTKAGRAFFKRKPATFDALREHFAELHPSWDARAPAYVVRMHVPLVQIPTGDPWGYPAAATFGLADAWLGSPVSIEAEPAHALVRRYLAAFGPATYADAQAWSGLQGLRTVFEDLRPELVVVRDHRKRELVDLPEAPRPDGDLAAPIRFLPEYDNAVLGHQDRTRIIADEHRPRIVTKNLQIRATYLVDGVVSGMWSMRKKRKTATLVLEPFAKLTKKVRTSLEEEGHALLAFLEPEAATHEILCEP